MNRRKFLIAGGGIALTGATSGYFGYCSLTSLTEYDASVMATRRSIAETPQISELIRYASLAPSGHNTQPWKFKSTPNLIQIFPDFSRRTPVVDPDDHHLYVSLGCAAENLSLAAQARGFHGELQFESSGTCVVSFPYGRGPRNESPLVLSIPRRQSTRSEYDRRRVSPSNLKTLAKSALLPGVDLVLLTEPEQILRVRDLVLAGNEEQMASPGFLSELKKWIRFNPREALNTGDGLYSAASGSPILPTWLGSLAFDHVFELTTENKKYSRQIESSSGIAVFVSHKADPAHWFQAGRACQRFALQATLLGLQHCFVNQPVEVERLRPELARLVGLPGRRPDLIMRFGYGSDLPFSPRRPTEAFIA